MLLFPGGTLLNSPHGTHLALGPPPAQWPRSVGLSWSSNPHLFTGQRLQGRCQHITAALRPCERERGKQLQVKLTTNLCSGERGNVIFAHTCFIKHTCGVFSALSVTLVRMWVSGLTHTSNSCFCKHSHRERDDVATYPRIY